MKKTVCVMAVMAAMLTVFFCTPVFAAPIYGANTRYDNGQLQIMAYAETLRPEPTLSYSDSAIVDGTVTHLVTLRIINNSSTNAWIDIPTITFTFGYTDNNIDPDVYSQVYNLYNYGPDFTVSLLSNTNHFYCIAPANWSNVGVFLLPPKTSITCIFSFDTKYRTITGNNPYIYHAYITGVSINGNPALHPTDIEPIGSNNDVVNAIDNVYKYMIGSNGLPLINSDLQSILSAINDIKSIMSSSNQTNNDISSDSGTLATQSDNVHSQEASYYAQNTRAIQSTGLSNYQFDNTAVSGLQGIRGDFIDVWNSLGGWNSIYIFSLTLGLALTILRHSPSAISSAIRRRRQNGE